MLPFVIASMNTHANIMLDLEVTVLEANPCILEIGAVHFDLSTGKELRSFRTIVSLQSCLNVGLVTTPDIITWLSKNIPGTLAASTKSQVTLHEALTKLAGFIHTSHTATKQALRVWGQHTQASDSTVRIWGNGAIADNTWIDSAYKACKMHDSKPWKFTGDMCVRTAVKTFGEIMGRDFAKEEVFKARKHDAVDDCRHQIRYLVKARNAVMNRTGPFSRPSNGHGKAREVVFPRPPRSDLKRRLEIEDTVNEMENINSKVAKFMAPKESASSQELAKSDRKSCARARVSLQNSYRQQSRTSVLPEKMSAPAAIHLGVAAVMPTGQDFDDDDEEALMEVLFEDDSDSKSPAKLLTPEDSFSELRNHVSGMSTTTKEIAAGSNGVLGQSAVRTPMGLLSPETSFSGP